MYSAILVASRSLVSQDIYFTLFLFFSVMFSCVFKQLILVKVRSVITSRSKFLADLLTCDHYV